MSIAIATEHLAVFSHGTTAIAPRCDMVGLHLLNFKVLAADGANTVLPLVDFALGVIIEGAYAKMMFVVVENIMEYA